jgi:LPS-assembly protein
MSRCVLRLALCVLASAIGPAWALAQEDLSSCRIYEAAAPQMERSADISRFHGSPEQAVRVDCDDMQFFADYMEIHSSQDLIKARGHIVFVSGDSRISAESMEFNTKTRTGTFYDARGTARISPEGDRSLFGAQEPDAYFWGAQLKKLGPAKYRITRGGFTTCVQPTPRWEIASGTVTLNLNEYALLTNSVFRVKGVPLLYMPVFYYPIQEDDRATGFLIPTYGASTFRGQTLSNAFFWAISRSQDATVYHDWMSQAGQQIGGEYRYIAAPGSQGNAQFSLLDERPTTPATGGASLPARRSYSLRGDVAQALPANFRARAYVDYFSSIETQQQYQQDIFRATNRSRRFSTHAAGSIGQYLVSAAVDRNDVFYSATSLVTYGSLPRIQISRPERPIGRTRIYFGANGEYVTLLRSATQNDVRTQDQGLTRLDVNPLVRIPFNRWPFFTINSVVGWRGTYWTESLSEAQPRQQVAEGIGRQYFDFQTRLTGPVFTRIFNTPDGRFAERYKHIVEPSLAIQRLTAIDQFDRFVKLEGGDFTVGNVTRYTYALTNRLYAKRDVAREVASVTVSQTYYTDANAAQYDRQYQTAFTARAPTHFSPVALHARASPSDRLQAEFRTEWDPTAKALRNIAANGMYADGEWLHVSAGWSQRRVIPNLPGFDDPNRADQYINALVNLRGSRNRVGGTYSFNYDLLRDRFLQQRWIAYYNAQCCGVGFEYQTFNLHGAFFRPGLTQDRRFNISFTLAGIGTFSNLFGAFGGQQGR